MYICPQKKFAENINLIQIKTMQTMIRTRKELRECLIEDGKNFKLVAFIPWYKRLTYRLNVHPNSDQLHIWKYIYHLRHFELYVNIRREGKGFWKYRHLLLETYHRFRLQHEGYMTGLQIPPNTIAAGLTIWHYGYIIINPLVRIGKGCTLYPGVLIGHKNVGEPAPIIGDNCFIASGAKIIGAIKIGNNVTIAQNAVVTKDIPDNVVVGGVPAKIIKQKE